MPENLPLSPGNWQHLMDWLAIGHTADGRVGTVGHPVVPLPLRPDPAFLATTFQAGHGWINNGAGTPNLNDTVDFCMGSQAISVVTNGAGTSSSIRKVAAGSWDLTGKIPVITFRCDDWTNLASILLYMGSSSFANFYTASYTDALASTGQTSMLIRDGEWGTLTIPWNKVNVGAGAPARNNITDLQVYAQDKNSVQIKVHWQSIGFIPEQSVFPNGVVSLVFDDGWDSQYTQAKLKMDQYGYSGTAYVIAGEQINNVNGYCTLAQLHALEDTSGWEVGAHAYDVQVHNDWTIAPIDPTRAEQDMAAQKSWLIQEGFRAPMHFAYPGGLSNTALDKVVKKYYSSARSLNASNHESLAPWRAHRLRTGMYVINTTTTGAIQTEIDNAYANKTWLIMVFHKIVASPAASTEYSIANFGTVIDYLHTKGIPVRTVSQVLGSVPATG